tara:strand:- start:172828 stop:173838 length:1011 start_codon:yes stop_codon:yes gene_type:complete
MTQFEKTLSIEFRGTGLSLKTNSVELYERISKDFSHFLVPELKNPPIFNITSLKEDRPSITIPTSISLSRESKNSKTYDDEKIRYNDYGDLISKYDYDKESGLISSGSIERLHEITYLLILSRVGKYQDLLGIHKVHALGFIYKGVCCVGMMNMGVGKSTLLMELLKDPEVELLSDDSPLIDGRGEVLSFPIRIGASELPEGLEIEDPKENIYRLIRKEYGEKNLICLQGIKNKIGTQYKKIVVFEGKRGNRRLTRASSISLWLSLQKHMVIGIGLPIIFEYFWESGISDFIRKTKIFFLRQRAAINFSRNCEFYKFSLGKSSEENAKALKELLEN